MITTPTIFILGAGASVDYGFPTGDELRKIVVGRQEISPLWQEPYRDAFAPDQHERLREKVGRFQRTVRDLNLTPIDRVVERFCLNRNKDTEENVQMWRLVVAQLILQSEASFAADWQQSSYNDELRKCPLNGQPRTCSPWFPNLFSRMEQGITAPDAFWESNRVWFVTFNYDRLLEQLFFWSLKSTFELSRQDAREMVTQLPIIHVHGQTGAFSPARDDVVLGHLEDLQEVVDLSSLHSRLPVAFGRLDQWHDCQPGYIPAAAAGIVPAHEEPNQQVHDAMHHTWVAASASGRPVRIVFLGFGFDPANVSKMGLLLKRNHSTEKACFATWRGGADSIPPRIAKVMESLGIDPYSTTQVHQGIRSLLDSLPD